jgi:hypothetical protein
MYFWFMFVRMSIVLFILILFIGGAGMLGPVLTLLKSEGINWEALAHVLGLSLVSLILLVLFWYSAKGDWKREQSKISKDG